MAEEALDARGAKRDADFFPLNDLPNELIVSIFAATDDPTWVRHTFPFVCRDWAALYLTKDASPLHETLVIDFEREVERAVEARGIGAPPVVDPSSVISWAERRAGSVRKLRLERAFEREALEYFSAEDLGALVAVVGTSLTDLSIDLTRGDLCKRPFWESLRDHVVPAGRLRSLDVKGIEFSLLESDVEPLGQLSGSLEELELSTEAEFHVESNYEDEINAGLPCFPKSFLALTMLRILALLGHSRITAIPAAISSLKNLEVLGLYGCGLASLPKELGELSGLTRLDLSDNENLGRTLAAFGEGDEEEFFDEGDEEEFVDSGDEEDLITPLRTPPPGAKAFPAALGKLKSLRELKLIQCGLRTVPAFVGELESLESLDLSFNKRLHEVFPAELEKLNSLRELKLEYCCFRTVPAFVGEQKSLESLDLSHCSLITVPAFVGELESLESLRLSYCDLASLPKELGELSGLTKLDLSYNENLGTKLPAAEAFPAELGGMKSLRELDLQSCGLRTVPSFVCKLESLESLKLFGNKLSSLPKELGELSRLTMLWLGGSKKLANAPQEKAFPAELGKLKSLRKLSFSYCRTVPAFVGELESLENLDLSYCDLSSLPKELGELSGLTKLDLGGNKKLGTTLPADEAFPEELGNMKSLRYLDLRGCGLRSLPSFVGELESLEVLFLSDNDDLQFSAPLDFLIEGCPRLRDVWLKKGYYGRSFNSESRAHLEAFKAKLLAKNPKAKVDFKR